MTEQTYTNNYWTSRKPSKLAQICLKRLRNDLSNFQYYKREGGGKNCACFVVFQNNDKTKTYSYLKLKPILGKAAAEVILTSPFPFHWHWIIMCAKIFDKHQYLAKTHKKTLSKGDCCLNNLCWHLVIFVFQRVACYHFSGFNIIQHVKYTWALSYIVDVELRCPSMTVSPPSNKTNTLGSHFLPLAKHLTWPASTQKHSTKTSLLTSSVSSV